MLLLTLPLPPEIPENCGYMPADSCRVASATYPVEKLISLGDEPDCDDAHAAAAQLVLAKQTPLRPSGCGGECISCATSLHSGLALPSLLLLLLLLLLPPLLLPRTFLLPTAPAPDADERPDIVDCPRRPDVASAVAVAVAAAAAVCPCLPGTAAASTVPTEHHCRQSRSTRAQRLQRQEGVILVFCFWEREKKMTDKEKKLPKNRENKPQLNRKTT